jgi:hypothetical protein
MASRNAADFVARTVSLNGVSETVLWPLYITR